MSGGPIRERIAMERLAVPPGGPTRPQDADGGGEPHFLEVQSVASSPPSPPNYGSTYSFGPGASTANLLRIDLEKRVNRHTGETRETWDNRLQFVLSLIGYAVGLGNVWRFPYLTQKNGGGAFLIPYVVMLVIEGVPLFYLELAVGQRLRKGAYGAWNQIHPYLAGTGIASCVVSVTVSLYYNTIMAWCLLYLAQSFQSPLPWASCPHRLADNGTLVEEPECKRAGSTTYFWYRETLQTAASVEEPAVFNWRVAVALVFAWLIVFFCMVRGIKSSGKVVYVTATFPYLVLVIFFFRGVTLHGFQRGLEHLFVPEWGKLLDPAVWLDAATQIFYSFGMAFGCLIALASYNPVRSNFFQETLIVTLCDLFTSIFTAIVVFSVLGFKATMEYEKCLQEQAGHNLTSLTFDLSNNQTECNFKELISKSASGTGLAFIAFTEAINQFPVAPLWSVLFFLMLLTLGLDSMFGQLEGAVTSVYDMMLFPTIRKEVICALTCLLCLALSMCFALNTGPYVFDLFDSFCANIPLLVIAFVEIVAISYCYGLKQLSEDIELMLGSRPSQFLLLCWRFLAPVAMLVIFGASLVELLGRGSVYEVWDASTATTRLEPWPWWCQVLAALLILVAVLWIPGVALVRHFRLVKYRLETPAFFPVEELREERNVQPHRSTPAERWLFGFKD